LIGLVSGKKKKMSSNSTLYLQKDVSLKARSRGCHLIDDEIKSAVKSELSRVRVGLMHVHLLHTSAALSLNENWDPDVRKDMADELDRLVPDAGSNDGRAKPLRHVMEGSDDLPAHIKSSLVGVSITMPITDGKLRLGSWQGLYLIECRNSAGSRRCVVTIHGSE
jgi:secondary thiamine-phosphate synthase enzyme